MNMDLTSIEKELNRREKLLDMLLVDNRTGVRYCANTIKSLHGKDFKSAKQNLAGAEKIAKKIKKYRVDFRHQVDHFFQEYVEAKVLFFILEEKEIPSFKKLNSPIIPYILGLMDCVGELKREMYEYLRKGDKKSAELYFSKMEWIFDQFLHLKYSNSILPEFRRKQDVARIQIEQARGELI